MLILLSPAKTQEFDTRYAQYDATQPEMLQEVATLITCLKSLNPKEIAKLMSVSDKIAALNYERFQTFDPKNFTRNNAKQALFALQGDAYQALDANSLSTKNINFLQNHLIILSGLYGVLKPLDLIQPYRLEMKTAIANPLGRDLYAFWAEKISANLEKKLATHKNKMIINLASNEYAKAAIPAKNKLSVITITFKEKKGDTYSVIGIHAKRARGLMVRYIAINEIDTPEHLKKFTEAGYRFDQTTSTEHGYVFNR